MILYCEKYDIAKLHFGIEDFELVDTVSQDAVRCSKRYKCWLGGGGIGEFDTIDEARARVFQYARSTLKEEHEKYKKRSAEIDAAITKLGNNPKYLGFFLK